MSTTERKFVKGYTGNINVQCPACNDEHRLGRCTKFDRMSLNEKRSLVKRSNLCWNCLGSGHQVSKCPSERGCKVCNKKHHTKIHEDKKATLVNCVFTSKQVLLATASVQIKSKEGAWLKVRALIDSGAQA